MSKTEKPEITTQCCECKRVVNQHGKWVHVEGELSGQVSHGYCQTCFDAAMDEAEAYVVRTA